MKVLIVANINSSHTRKWALALKARGLKVGVFSINHLEDKNSTWLNGLDAVSYPEKSEKWLLRKYRLAFSGLLKLLREFNPDVLHSHFLTNYTFLACLTGFKPHVATAWGSDVYLFPTTNRFNRWLLKYNLRRADAVVSTSKTMANEIAHYTNKKVEIIPFGVDFSLYKYHPRKELLQAGEIKIACFKNLSEIYGQDILIEACAIAKAKCPELKFKLQLFGQGNYQRVLEQKIAALGLNSDVQFMGLIPADQIPAQHEKVDVCVYLSRRESFGVSLVEAMAAGVPLIVSSIPAFKEVTGAETNALFADNASEVADKLIWLGSHPQAVNEMAERARLYAKSAYDLENNMQQQIALYQQLCDIN